MTEGVGPLASEQAAQGAEHGGGMAIDPMHQFEIQRLVPIELGWLDASFTNSSLWMVIAAAVISFVLLASSKKLVPSRMQSVGELAYEFIFNMVRDTMGEQGRKFFPFIFTLFMFVLASNMLGLVPYSFTVTSHIIITFALAATVFVGATVYGFVKHGFGYLKLFAPDGIPAVMLPLLIVIEVISYLSRPISLSVRLFANMMAGHTMLKVFGAFVVALGWAGVVPFVVMVGFTGLEVLIAFLQAFVFAILSCMYINDALHPHH
jgi:F-type H+-transporting ATPase subunit a